MDFFQTLITFINTFSLQTFLNNEIVSFCLTILKNWWWAFLLALLYLPVKDLYFWWLRWELNYPKRKWVMIEIKPPKEILKPLTAMEDIFSILWGIIDTPNLREKWCEGFVLDTNYWFSCEIVGIEGKIHFFIRCVIQHQKMIESAIYSHYPEVEISLVDDYTRVVPQNIPNENWDLYGEDYYLSRESAYPIKTYVQFFEPAGEKISQEEKRIDPIDSFLEALSKLGPGEQFWFQICCNPIIDSIVPWQSQGKAIIDKISQRPVKEKPKSMIEKTIEVLIAKPSKTEEKKEIAIPSEMKLLPGEREIITQIGRKIGKKGYRTWIRTIYVAKRENWNYSNVYLGRSFTGHFSAEDLNTFRFWGKTRPRIHYWFRKRRVFVRKRNIFENYIKRLPPRFPYPPLQGVFVLNPEELATIFHFPIKIIVSSLPYVESKKGGPPPFLPTGE